MNKMNDLLLKIGAGVIVRGWLPHRLKISTGFCKSPGARYPEEGGCSGQEFRENVLFPTFQEAKRKGAGLTVDLDGTSGLGTAFLEESFGGLIRRDLKDAYEFTHKHMVHTTKSPTFTQYKKP